VGAGDPAAAAERLSAAAGVPVLPVPNAALDLAAHRVVSHSLPTKATADAMHVALAAVHGVDYLLTWNCRHLANATLRDRIAEACMQRGFRSPKICTPRNLIEVQP
jgi:hypothetical protein